MKFDSFSRYRLHHYKKDCFESDLCLILKKTCIDLIGNIVLTPLQSAVRFFTSEIEAVNNLEVFIVVF
jgi:hypothetical protein